MQSQLRGEIKVAYKDETWVWRYHSTKKGIAPVGTTHRNIKSGKGEHLIVVDAITKDGPLRCNGVEVTSSVHSAITSVNSGHGGNNSLSDDESSDKDVVSALWTWVYQKKGDYHDAMDHEKFQDWVNNRFIPTWKKRYPKLLRDFVLDNAPYHIGGLRNPFVMTKPECADYLRGAGLNNVYISRDDGMTLHAFKIPFRGHNFAKSPRGPSVEELQQTVYDIMEDYEPHLLRTWVETRFEAEGWTIIFNPPYLCNFQPIELLWAYVKNSIGQRYFKGRDMAWIASKFARRAHRIDCAALIRHAHESMDEWISLDTILPFRLLRRV